MFYKLKYFSIRPHPCAGGREQGLILGENRSSTIIPLLSQIIRICLKEDIGIPAIILDKTYMVLVTMRKSSDVTICGDFKLYL